MGGGSKVWYHMNPAGAIYINVQNNQDDTKHTQHDEKREDAKIFEVKGQDLRATSSKH